MSIRDDAHSNPACAAALAARDCQELARILSIGRTRIAPISKPIFAIWCGSTGLRAAIEDHANSVQSPLRSLALTLRDFLGGPPTAVVDFTDPSNQQALAAWQQAGALTSAQVTALTELGRIADPISAEEVAQAVYNPDGTYK